MFFYPPRLRVPWCREYWLFPWKEKREESNTRGLRLWFFSSSEQGKEGDAFCQTTTSLGMVSRKWAQRIVGGSWDFFAVLESVFTCFGKFFRSTKNPITKGCQSSSKAVQLCILKSSTFCRESRLSRSTHGSVDGQICMLAGRCFQLERSTVGAAELWGPRKRNMGGNRWRF